MSNSITREEASKINPIINYDSEKTLENISNALFFYSFTLDGDGKKDAEIDGAMSVIRCIQAALDYERNQEVRS